MVPPRTVSGLCSGFFGAGFESGGGAGGGDGHFFIQDDDVWETLGLSEGVRGDLVERREEVKGLKMRRWKRGGLRRGNEKEDKRCCGSSVNLAVESAIFWLLKEWSF